MNPALDQLIASLGITFNDPQLLVLALTHRSFSGRNNERLEFLGDAVLGMLVAEALHQQYPEQDEGHLSRFRAALVKRQTLAILARELRLGDYIYLGPGELKSGGFRRESILADAFEALLGAIYLDQGLECVREKLMSWYGDRLEAVSRKQFGKDPKTRLQELMQSIGAELPVYRMVKTSGDAHNKRFLIECKVNSIETPGQGEGDSRRVAEQAAAGVVLEMLSQARSARCGGAV